MKSIEQLKKLDKNPNYTLTDEERQVLQSQQYTGVDSGTISELPSVDSSTDSVKTTGDIKKKLTRENVAAKETGKVAKHPSDPATE